VAVLTNLLKDGLLETPVNVTVPVYVPTGNPAALAVMVAFSEALPDEPLVNPEESDEGETESHPLPFV
jgi:hypothetical protein